jgi:hypothetical protein
MSLTPEQQKELEEFPTALRALIEAELAAGNAVEEVGHRFPAPPAGAYFKLARAVSTRPRAAGDGLAYVERSGSNEFTDAQRFYFVIEPPNPPPPVPDMDAIRAAHEPKPGGAPFDH